MNKIKPIVYCDMDGVLCNIHKHRLKHLKENPDIKYPQCQYGFFMELEEIPHSVGSVKMLSEDFDMWFLTAPSTRNPSSYAEKNYWIRNHFGQEWCDKLIISPNKSLLRGQYLIDDNLKGRGQDMFDGKLIHFSSPQFPNWFEVNKFLYTSIGKDYETGYEMINK